MAEVVNMLIENKKKEAPTPHEIQGNVGDLVKQFSLLIQTINMPGLTGASLLKALQEHQKPQKESDVSMKK